MEQNTNYEAPDSQITYFGFGGETGPSGPTDGVTLPDHDWDGL